MYFELDHAATQADKRERLRRVHADTAAITFIPVDFGRDAIADALAAAGHSSDAPTYFLCEGVTAYLPVSDVFDLGRALAGRAGRGSTFAIDIVERGPGKPLTSRLMLRLMRTGTAMMGERFVTLLEINEAHELLVRAGWSDVTFQRPPAGLYPVAFALASA